MKMLFKILLSIFSIIIVLILGLTIWLIIFSSKLKIDESLFINVERQIVYLDQNSQELYTEADGNLITEYNEIPKHVIDAFVSVEDKRFYQHNGIDYKGFARALINNIKSKSFKEGGSTITQQLIKNTHLSNEKTIKRKLEEMLLARKLEKKYSKKQIMESYLNTIYFGDNCYGITNASMHYFGKKVNALEIDEGALLAGLIKAPSKYSPNVNYELSKDRRNVVLKLMKEQGYISDKEFQKSVKKEIVVKNSKKENYTYKHLASKEVTSIIEKYPYSSNKFYVKTNLDNAIENKLNDVLNSFNTNYDKSAVVIDKYGKIKAYYSTCGEIQRQPGSTIKPLLVYTPAIELGLVDSCSYINDSPCTINGYSPKNYNDIYRGEISVCDSLAKSSNVCAIKLLDLVGIKNAKNMLKSVNLELENEDDNLSLALGAYKHGISLTNLTGAYNLYVNDGNYTKPFCVNSIDSENGSLIYKNLSTSKKVFSLDTIEIIREMLYNCVINGSAKKLSTLEFKVYSKTGTVGNEYGNTDAYNVSFNSEYIIGVWVGNKSNKLMDNSITGGGTPTRISEEIWKEIYKENTPPKDFDIRNAVKVKLDKESYEKDKNIELADNLTPDRYVREELFKYNRIPKKISTRFTLPKVINKEIHLINNGFSIRLCVAEWQEYKIFKEYNNVKKIIYDSKVNGKKDEIIDQDIISSTIYHYSVIPYTVINGRTILGKEEYFDIIKSPNNTFDDNWWDNEFN